MKAFFGRSFAEKDDDLITKIADFITSLDVECVNAKSAKSQQLSDKVKQLILDCDIFVGVFTCDQPICKQTKTKWRCNPKIQCTEYTTSNWVLQESGFAIAAERDLILFVEKGIAKFPKLQGDLEYILFDSKKIEDTFTKISQMISHIKAKTSGGGIEKSRAGSTIPDKTKPEEQEGQPEKKTKDEKEQALDKVYKALFREQNYIEAQRIFNDEAEVLLDEEDKVSIRAFILRLSQPLGDKKAFGKLQKLVEENKDNPRVIKQLAHRYKEMGEFKKAKDQFLLAAEKYDINDPKKKSGLVNAHVEAARCLADDDELNDALVLLKKLLSNPDFQDSKAQILKGMAEICKDKEDIERFFIYAEAALDVDPCDTDLRFTLAYAYSHNKYEKLSLLHYKKLTDTTINSAALNNLGVQYDTLKISYKGVESYYKSADENETLAMANLAQKYLNEGFVKDARELVNRANKLSSEGVTVDSQVGKAQERINDLTQEQRKKERLILSEAEKERKFRVDYSKAFCSHTTVTKEDIEGVWKTPWGDFEVKFDENNKFFSVSGKNKIEYGSYLSSALMGQVGSEKKYKDRFVQITGTIENMSGKYKIEVEDKIGGTLLTGGKTHEASGYMIINESRNCIKIMEKTKNDAIEFKQWEKPKETMAEQ